MATEYLIDGYNLLFGGDAYPRRSVAAIGGPKQLERARERLLAWIARHVENPHLVTVVFDSPPKPYSLLQRIYQRVHELHVHFASEYEDADALIGELCQQHPHASRLVVVSDDREVQGFARRARARSLTCEEFLQQLRQSPQDPESGKSPAGSKSRPSGSAGKTKPIGPAEKAPDSAADREHWLEVFGSADEFIGGDFSMPRLPLDPPPIPDDKATPTKSGNELAGSPRPRSPAKGARPKIPAKRKRSLEAELLEKMGDQASDQKAARPAPAKKTRRPKGEDKKKPSERSLDDFYRDMREFEKGKE